MSPLLLVAPLMTLTPLLMRLLFAPYFTPFKVSKEHTVYVHSAVHSPMTFMLWLHCCQALNELCVGVALMQVLRLASVSRGQLLHCKSIFKWSAEVAIAA